MNKFPYPVLSEEGSSYVEGIKFDILFTRNITLPNELTLEFNVDINSNVLKDLIDNNTAKIFIKIQTKYHNFICNLDSYSGTVQCSIDTRKIPQNDNLICTAYVTANEEFELLYSDEFLPIYGEDYAITLRRNDVLAISNTEKLTYNTSNNDFIKFSVSSELSGKGYKINYENNFVNVLIGPEFNTAYSLIRNNKKDLCSIFDSHIVFEIFVHILIDLIQQYDEYKDSDWYSLFEQVFIQTEEYKSFEDFIHTAKDGNLISIELVYALAHSLINNQIENSIITQSRIEET